MLGDPAWAASAIPILPSQLIFSLTQPPTCGAEVALDDIMFRNCGLPGESHVFWDGNWVGCKTQGSSPIARVSWGTVPWPEHEVGSEKLPLEPAQGTLSGVLAMSLWPGPSVTRVPHGSGRAAALRGPGEPLSPRILPGTAALLRRHRRLRGQLGRGRGAVQ